MQESGIQGVLDDLKSGKIILADGAADVVLAQERKDITGGTSQYNLTSFISIRNLHQAYAQAGSRIAFANTLHSSRVALEKHGLDDKIKEINRKGVEAAQASGNPVFGLVTADYGGMVGDFGSVSLDGVRENYKEQIDHLAKAGADVIYLLTHCSIDEARCAVQAAKEVTDIPVILAFSFNNTERGATIGHSTYWGVHPSDVVGAFKDDVAILGFNCGNKLEYTASLVSAFREQTDMPLIAQPSLGQPKVESLLKRPDYITPEQFASFIPGIIKANEGHGLIFGGCCGTTPYHIGAASKVLVQR